MDDPTKSDQIRPPEVSDQQSIAIDALTAGRTHREAAGAAGVQRSTVTAWCNHNITFIAELNRRRRQRLVAAGERLHEATGAALDVVLDSINRGNATTALALIRIVGVEHLLKAAHPGPVSVPGVVVKLARGLEADLALERLVNPDLVDVIEEISANNP